MEISYKYEVSKVDKMTFIKIRKSTGFKVTLCDLGASVYEVIHDNTLMTLTPKYPSDFMKTSVYNGKTIGRVTNRIKDAKIKVNNLTYYLDPNENMNTLHGGRNGLSTKFFEYKIEDFDEVLMVKFFYDSPDLDAGFPGHVKFLISYVFSKTSEDSFMEIMSAISDQKTPLNLTNHLYFTLGDSSNENLKLFMNAKAYLEVDENKIPTHKVPLDGLFEYNTLGGQFNLDIDNYVYKNSKFANPYKATLILYNAKYELHIVTSLPGVQIYTDIDGDDIIYKDVATKNRRAIAIEPSYPISQMHYIDEKKEYLTKTIYYFLDA